MGRSNKVLSEEEKAEIDEIIQLKLQELNNITSRLTYTNVYNYNKKLVSQQKLRENGELFHNYSYAIWAQVYNGKPYYGRQKIDEIKSQKVNPLLLGDGSEISELAIMKLVERYKNSPDVLAQNLYKLVEKSEKKIADLTAENIELSQTIKTLRAENEGAKTSVLTIFHNSQWSTNSLQDVMNSESAGDTMLKNECLNLFKGNLPDFENPTPKKAFNISEIDKLL